MTEKLNNIEQTNFENGPERTTGVNPEVISQSNEPPTSPIIKIDPTSLKENNNQREEVFSPSDKGEIDKGGASTSGDEWHENIEKKRKGNLEGIPL